MEFLNALEQMECSIWVREPSPIGAFPTFLVVHTIGMAIVAGCSALMTLVILGFWPNTMPINPLERLFPLMWTGFWINTVTGVLLLLPDPPTPLTTPHFYFTIAFPFPSIFLPTRT